LAIDDDDLNKSVVASEIAAEVERSLQGTLVQSGVVGMVSQVPLVGSVVNEMLTELAIRRVYDRL